MRRSIVFISLLWLFSFTLRAQMQSFAPASNFFSPTDSQKVYLSMRGTSFFKNNEYFNPIEEGYTLIGFYLEPSAVLQLTRDFRLEAGAGILKFSGRKGFYQTEPLFRVQYQPVNWFQMLIGTLHGGSNHGLVEPLYRWELNFTNPMENGLQFLFNTKIVNADVWLDWQKFILHNDPFQEELSVGISSEWFLDDKTSDFTVSLPLQTVFQHHGGQIISVNLPLETLANWATGIKVHKTIKQNFLHFWEAEVYYLGFTDLSPQKLQQFRNGYGIYPKTKIGFGNFSAEIGYFHGTRFMAPMGERLFHSATIPMSNIIYTHKNIGTGKFWYNKKVNSGITLGAYFESYTDFINQKTDYAYGVHLVFSQDFFLLKYR
jgi:hypothetical protein